MLRWFYNTDHQFRFVEALEFHDAIGFCEERIVASTTDILTRKKLGSALAYKDTAARNYLSAEALHTEALCIAVAAIPRASHSFFMCHTLSPFRYRVCFCRY